MAGTVVGRWQVLSVGWWVAGCAWRVVGDCSIQLLNQCELDEFVSYI